MWRTCPAMTLRRGWWTEMATDGSPGAPDQPAGETGLSAQRGRARTKVGDWAGVRQARRATEWGKQKYAGSSAETCSAG
jgi:hypothetical protein